MGDDIGGVKKMGASNRHSVAQVLLMSMLMMLVATSYCMMSTTTTTTTAGNSTAASSAWCDRHIIDGQCILITQAYGGGEHLEDLDVDVMDRMLVEYDDSGETSSRRVLAAGGVQPLDIKDSLRVQGPVCHNQQGQRYTCQNKPNKDGRISECQSDAMFNRVCPM